MPKALDLFCGLGGWSDGLHAEGFQVTGVEIEPKIAMLYKHPCMIADVRKLSGKGFRGFDLIVGSPPCRDFSLLANFSKVWKTPRNIDNGLSMVNAFLDFVRAAKPKFWLMENVPRLKKWIILEPKAIALLKTPRMKRAFWGNFPPFLIPYKESRFKNQEITGGKYRSWFRAKIPLPVASALGQAVMRALEE